MTGTVYICSNSRPLILNQLHFNVAKCNVQVCRKIIKYLVSVGADMDVCLTQFGHCNFISPKHAYIFYDEVRSTFLYVYSPECIHQGPNLWAPYTDQFVVPHFSGSYSLLAIQVIPKTYRVCVKSLSGPIILSPWSNPTHILREIINKF